MHGMAVEGRAGTIQIIQIIQIPDPRKAGVSLGEVWLGLWEARRLEIRDVGDSRDETRRDKTRQSDDTGQRYPR